MHGVDPALQVRMIRIKKYSNRRLYNTESSSYVNLSEIADLVRSGEVIEVSDAKSGEDLTQAVLLQILIEEQGAGALLPSGLLHRIIRTTVDHPFQKLVMGQLAAGLSMLDQQLGVFEMRSGPRSRPEAPPREAPKEAASPPPEEAEPAPAPAKRPKPSDEPGELDALRARLAALERRLAD